MSDPTNVTAPMPLPAPRPECQEACDCPDNHRRACWEMHNPVWPPTSERDAHLGAYQQHAREPQPLELQLPSRLPGHDPAPSWLTAAQEIRLAITLKAMELADKATGTEVEADDEDIANFVRVLTGVVVPIAVMVEHGHDETPQIREWAQRCPDPALHDEEDRTAARAGLLALTDQRNRAVIRITELERQRDAVLAYIADLDRDLSFSGRDMPAGFSQIRAIYAGHGAEERGDGS